MTKSPHYIIWLILIGQMAISTFPEQATGQISGRIGLWEAFDVKDGVPASGVVRVSESRQAGRLWGGTPCGVSRFDGRQWTTYTTANSTLLDDRTVVIKRKR